MFTLTSTQISDLSAIYYGNGLHKFADAYDYICSLLTADGSPAPGIDNGAWQWFQGAAQVNRGVGPFSQFILAYTNEQHIIRFGTALSDTQLQDASDSIAAAVINDILTSGSIPSLHNLGVDDASGTAADIFRDANDIPDPSGWSGNILFPLLGDSSFFENTIIDQPDDTYDLLAAFKSSQAGGYNISGSNYAAVVGQIISLIGGTGSTISIGDGAAMAAAIYDFMIGAYGQSYQAYLWESIVLDTKGSSSSISGTSENDIINARDGDDVILGSAGADIIDGGAGSDEVDYTTISGAINITLNSDSSTSVPYVGSVDKVGILNSDLLYDVEKIQGSTGDDVFDLQDVDDRINSLALAGGSGQDLLDISVAPEGGLISRTITGDKLTWGSGTNVTFGGFEDVKLEGDTPDLLQLTDDIANNAIITPKFDLGSSGLIFNDQFQQVVDTVDASLLSSAVVISLEDSENETVLTGGGALVEIRNAEGAIGSNYDDTLRAGQPGDGSFGEFLSGGDGNDVLIGSRNGSLIYNWLDGGSGDDIINPSLGDGSVLSIMNGGSGDDEFFFDKQDHGPFTPDNLQISYLISDPDNGDSIVWNGYEISGGEVSTVDEEYNSNFSGIFYAYIDDVGDLYYWSGYDGDTLVIDFPDDSAVEIAGFENGMMGINMGTWDFNTGSPPPSNIVGDGIWEDIDNLSGRADALANPGPIPSPGLETAQPGIASAFASAERLVQATAGFGLHRSAELVADNDATVGPNFARWNFVRPSLA